MKMLKISVILSLVSLTAQIKAAPVVLNFAWEPGISASVHYATQNMHEEGLTPQTSTIKGSYILNVAEHDRGLEISYENFNLSGLGGDDKGDPRVVFEEAMKEAYSLAPSFIVSKSGEYRGLANPDQFITEAKERFTAKIYELPEGMQAPMTRLLNPSFFMSQFDKQYNRSWSRNISFWKGKELEIGKWESVKETIQLEAYGDLEIPVSTSYRVKNECSCQDEASDKLCVELELTSEIDPEKSEELIAGLENALSQKTTDKVSISTINLDRVVTIIIDPATLLARTVKERRKLTLEALVNGEARNASETERAVLKIRYLN